jgi:hypothetical protein
VKGSHSYYLPFHSKIVKAVNTLVKLAASQNKSTLEEAEDEGGEEEESKDYLENYTICHYDIHLSVSEYILFGGQVPTLKPGSTKTQLQKQKEKWGFFRRLCTKITKN